MSKFGGPYYIFGDQAEKLMPEMMSEFPRTPEMLNNTPEIAQLTGRNPQAQRVYVRPEGNPISSPLGVFNVTDIDAFTQIDQVVKGALASPIPPNAASKRYVEPPEPAHAYASSQYRAGPHCFA